MPERAGFGQSRRWGRWGFLRKASEMGFHQASPKGWEKRDGRCERQGPRQVGRIVGQAQGWVRARGVAVVIGMARRVQKERGGKPMRSVPRVAGIHRLVPAIGQGGAGEAVMLDIVGQVDLQLGMQGDQDPDRHAAGAAEGGGHGKGCEGEEGIGQVGMQAGPRAALAQGGFGPEPCDKAAYGGARQIAPEAAPFWRAGRIVGGGDEAVMHKAMTGGVMADEKGGIDRNAEPDLRAPGAVDQLMRRRMGNLAEPEAGGEDEGGLFRP